MKPFFSGRGQYTVVFVQEQLFLVVHKLAVGEVEGELGLQGVALLAVFVMLDTVVAQVVLEIVYAVLGTAHRHLALLRTRFGVDLTCN